MKTNFKKILAVLLAVLMAVTVIPFAFAGDGEEEPVVPDKGTLLSNETYDYYKYIITNDDLIVQTADAADVKSYVFELVKYTSEDTTVVIPADLDSSFGTADKKVIVIGTAAFAENAAITKVTFPNNVVEIGMQAFCNCTGLTSMNFELPDSVKKIGDRAFIGCTGLTEFHIPSSLEYIGAGAFDGCTNFVGNATVKSEVLIEGETDYADIASLSLPAGVSFIGDGAFASCESIVNVVIDCAVTEIYNGTFTNCKGLERVELGENVAYLGSAFNNAFTGHKNISTEKPKLIIKNPHCVIVPSEEIDHHMVIVGVKYSTANTLADKGYRTGPDRFGVYVVHPYTFIEIENPNHTYTSKVVAPKCLEKGYTEWNCLCGTVDDVPYRNEYTDPTGHIYDEGTKEFDASEYLQNYCNSKSLIKYTCTECGNILYNTEILTPHDFETRCTATCTKSGATVTICKRCTFVSSSKNAAPLGHDWQPVENEGDIVSRCSRCGETRSKQDVCSCNCHKTTGLFAFIYKIQLFLWRLFGISKVCECGAIHY